MEQSILEATKTMITGNVGLDSTFDIDMITFINSAFFTLKQLGVGPEEGYSITDTNNTWSEFTDNTVLLSAVKNYVYLKVRMAFDPPQGTALIDSSNRMLSELEYRMSVEAGHN